MSKYKYLLWDIDDTILDFKTAALERSEMSKEAILTGRFKEFFSSEGLDDSIALDFNND